METPQTQTPAQPRTDYDKELSVGTYAGKKIYETVVSIGSGIVGGLLGVVALAKITKPAEGEALIKNIPYLGKMPGFRSGVTLRNIQWGGIGGAMLGTITGGLILGYEHWQKVKREQMQVDEITKDISDIEVFKKTDPELAAENKRLWGELEKREAQHGQHPQPVVSHVQNHGPAHGEQGHDAKKHAEHDTPHGEKKHADGHEKPSEHHAKKDDRGESWKDAVHASKQEEHHQEAAR